jgi:hypothetical protein
VGVHLHHGDDTDDELRPVRMEAPRHTPSHSKGGAWVGVTWVSWG